MWKRLRHPNIVSFKGVTFEPLQLVSEWMPGGELREYIKNNRHQNIIKLVSQFPRTPIYASSCPQLLDIAKGLGYLHSHNVIHGDLKGVCVTLSFMVSALMVKSAGKHSCGCSRECTNCRFWSRNCRARLKIARQLYRPARGHTSLYCARNLEKYWTP